MPVSASSPQALVTIHLDALAHNYRLMQTLSGDAQCAAAVKANAYGLGLAQVVETLLGEACDVFFVAHLQEAIALRALAKSADIYVLNGLLEDPDIYRQHNILPCLNSVEQVKKWQKGAAALFIDSGFNRLGLSVPDILETPDLCEHWQPSLILSHLACADQPQHKMNAAQCETFATARALLPDAPASLANSAGVLLGKDYHLNMTRCGISLYGGQPCLDNPLPDLQTVVSLTVPILQTRELSQGETIGYGARFSAPHDMVVGILAIGYADGLMRHAGRAAPPFVEFSYDGQPTPLIGRVSMDLSAIDLTNLAQCPRAGDMVEIFGAHNPIDRVAAQAGSIAYELLTSIGNRYKYSYHKTS